MPQVACIGKQPDRMEGTWLWDQTGVGLVPALLRLGHGALGSAPASGAPRVAGRAKEALSVGSGAPSQPRPSLGARCQT